MILVDTSVWRRHLRTTDPTLVRFLGERRVWTHECVIQELVLGGIVPGVRRSLLALHRILPVPGAEVLAAIDTFRLAQTGLGAVDAQLFVAAHRAGAALYTADEALAREFTRFQPVGWSEPRG